MIERVARHLKQKNKYVVNTIGREAMLHLISVANGDTTRRSDVYTEFQLSIPKDDRLKGTWTLQQYETAYRQAFYDAVKSANPKWKPGMSFDTSVIRNLSREDIDNSGSSLFRVGNCIISLRNFSAPVHSLPSEIMTS